MDFEKYLNPTPYTRETREEYKRVEREMEALFRLDLEDECSVAHDAPYADALYRKAWADGHSSGFGGVHLEYIELVEFVETILKAVKTS